MTIDLASLFAEQQSSKIDWNGPLFSLYELPTGTSRIVVRFLVSTSTHRQGLRLKIRGGTLEIDALKATDIVLWRDSAPDEVRASVHWSSKGSRSLRVWNTWEVNGVAHAWLGNAGIRVTEKDPGAFELRCSDGEGEPDFSNLTVEVFAE